MRYKGEIFGCEWNERQSSEISIALFQLTLTNNALKIIYVFTEVASWWYDRNSQFQILLQVQDVHVNEDHIYIHTSATPFKLQAVSWPAVSCRQWQCRQFAWAGRTFQLNILLMLEYSAFIHFCSVSQFLNANFWWQNHLFSQFHGESWLCEQ